MFRCLKMRRLKAEKKRRSEWRAVLRENARLSREHDRAWAAYDKMETSREKLSILSMLTFGNKARRLTADDYRDIADGCEKIVRIEQRARERKANDI